MLRLNQVNLNQVSITQKLIEVKDEPNREVSTQPMRRRVDCNGYTLSRVFDQHLYNANFKNTAR